MKLLMPPPICSLGVWIGGFFWFSGRTSRVALLK
ncbi:hypothetical protein A2U01_0040730, partial [Trifolium medium]|nr:hypothetical protein [Trifolium medium]